MQHLFVGKLKLYFKPTYSGSQALKNFLVNNKHSIYKKTVHQLTNAASFNVVCHSGLNSNLNGILNSILNGAQP